jgi:hypothetical protein
MVTLASAFQSFRRIGQLLIADSNLPHRLPDLGQGGTGERLPKPCLPAAFLARPARQPLQQESLPPHPQHLPAVRSGRVRKVAQNVRLLRRHLRD